MDQIEKTKVGVEQSNGQAKSKRLDVMKTYKIYIDGKFPRTESGRYYILKNSNGENSVNICQSSRKDFREAVVAARKVQPSWAAKSAYNKGQILYRIAEMLEGRKTQFVEELMQQGSTQAKAEKEAADKLAKEQLAKEKEEADRIAKEKAAKEKGETFIVSDIDPVTNKPRDPDVDAKHHIAQPLSGNKYKETQQKADGYFKMKRWAEAKTAYEEMLKLKEGDPYATGKLAEIEKLNVPK